MRLVLFAGEEVTVHTVSQGAMGERNPSPLTPNGRCQRLTNGLDMGMANALYQLFEEGDQVLSLDKGIPGVHVVLQIDTVEKRGIHSVLVPETARLFRR